MKQGDFVWYELATSDVDAAEAFAQLAQGQPTATALLPVT